MHDDVVFQAHRPSQHDVLVQDALTADRYSRSDPDVSEYLGTVAEALSLQTRTRVDESTHDTTAMIAWSSLPSRGGSHRGFMLIGAQIHPTSIISSDAELGSGVTVGPYAVINANVSVGDGSYVDSHTVLGAPTAEHYGDPQAYEPALCRIGEGAVIRSHCIVVAL